MIAFVKGHGTENDFVLVADPDDALDLTPDLVRDLCDRRRGVGADGVIRLVASRHLPEGAAVLAEAPYAEWFMDYRNADGSVAEMCGNGVRVFGAFVEHLGLADLGQGGELAVGTRAGVKRITREPGGWYVVDMGEWRFPGGDDAVGRGYDAEVAVAGWTAPRPALSVDLGNPHTVVALADEAELDALDLTAAPAVRPEPAAGTNVELVVPLGEAVTEHGTVGRLRMRVHERGVGETRSCGTGTCAAALAVRAWAGSGAPDTWLVDVPGGTVRVRALRGGRVELAGPAELVFAGTFDPAGGVVGDARGVAAISPRAASAPAAP
ncbi:diaminopimelate epimerase [Luteimicrobium subarcticum]|uniref:Diaminopimelate epimerase n=1 Tax=Luteimicrobium subarcticum TaxID=620910 RepID=A0A2M8WTV3_9MICO|nr:diaminopimelate epimerase [Luteimicrobium subarcticum]PJI94367.1 diaminopimelate epimerase [Luteimicrobium subarcticum]